MRLFALAAILCLTLASASAQSIRPSFDCNKAHFPDEQVICGDDHLSQLDQAASIALGQIAKDSIKAAREDAFEKLKDRHACGISKVCILDNQVGVIASLDDMGAKVSVPPWVGAYRLSLFEEHGASFVDGLPLRVGSCTRTKIAGLATRFGDTIQRPTPDGADGGVSVDFANTGHQVSYSFDEAVAASAIGDPVVLCLVSIPRNCPKGDDRGRIYSATNLRTKGSWILPDAQHMCGGA